MQQQLSLHMYVLTQRQKSSLYALPLEIITKRQCFTDASVHRPAVLLFDTRRSAERFLTNTWPNLSMCSFTSKWSVPGYLTSSDYTALEDVGSFMEATCTLKYTSFNSTAQAVATDRSIHTEQLNHIDNDLLLNLTLCAYVVYFWVEHVKSHNNGLEIQGILLNQRTAFEEDHEDFRRDYILSHLNQTFYSEDS